MSEIQICKLAEYPLAKAETPPVTFSLIQAQIVRANSFQYAFLLLKEVPGRKIVEKIWLTTQIISPSPEIADRLTRFFAGNTDLTAPT